MKKKMYALFLISISPFLLKAPPFSGSKSTVKQSFQNNVQKFKNAVGAIVQKVSFSKKTAPIVPARPSLKKVSSQQNTTQQNTTYEVPTNKKTADPITADPIYEVVRPLDTPSSIYVKMPARQTQTAVNGTVYDVAVKEKTADPIYEVVRSLDTPSSIYVTMPARQTQTAVNGTVYDVAVKEKTADPIYDLAAKDPIYDRASASSLPAVDRTLKPPVVRRDLKPSKQLLPPPLPVRTVKPGEAPPLPIRTVKPGEAPPLPVRTVTIGKLTSSSVA